MLPKQHRLPRQTINLVLKTGKRISQPLFQIICAENTLAYSRFAFVVGSKIDKRATARNRIKRILRESIHHLLPTISSGYDIVFVIKRNFAEKKEVEIELELKNVLSK